MTSIRDHADRDAIREIAARDLERLAIEHGARRHGRAFYCCFHENTRTPAASVHRGRFHCFACGLNLDPFDFVQRAQGVNFKTALEYLAARYCVPLNDRKLSDIERRQYLQQRAAANREARELVAWREGLIEVLRGHRNVYLRAYHRCFQFVLKHGFETSFSDLAADASEHYLQKYQELDLAVARIERAPWRALINFYRSRQAEAA